MYQCRKINLLALVNIFYWCRVLVAQSIVSNFKSRFFLIISLVCSLFYGQLHAEVQQLGDLAPRGVPDGQLDAGDLTVMQRIVLGELVPTDVELLIGDVSPVGLPDSVLNISDVLILQRAILDGTTLGTIQLVPPAPVLDSVSQPSNINPLPISGSALPGLSVDVYVNNILLQSIVADEVTGQFSTSVILEVGINEIYAISSNGINDSAASNIITFDYQLANGGTLSGDISGAILASNTTYTVISNATVSDGQALTIEQGAMIKFAPNTSLRVAGILDVNGTAINPVLFTSYESYSAKGDWDGIYIGNGSVANIDHAIIEYADYGIYFDGSSGLITNSIIRYNTYGAYFYRASTASISNSSITNNDYGIYAKGDLSSEAFNPQPVITNSSIYDNSLYNYYTRDYVNGYAVTLNATNNWWGSADVEAVLATIYDNKDIPEALPLVNINPILQGPGDVSSPVEVIREHLPLPEPEPVPTGTVVGSLGGDFSVSPTGAANYSIPIEIPAGTVGMQPEISLEYDSQVGNGIVGVGWSIGGISQITRCPANKAIDGYVGSVNYDMSDKFCLNGQRLILTSGTYGANGSVYRTEIDSQQKITSYGTAGNGPAYFEVETPSGVTMTYGFEEGIYDSRIQVINGFTKELPTVKTWALGKVEDVYGNYYKLAYELNINWNSDSVTRIDYTGNDTQGVTAFASVVFEYAVRDDTGDYVVHYNGGVKNAIFKRLTNIKTYVDGGLVKDYKLTYGYQNTTKQSRLTSVQECSPSQCKPATTFGWQNSTLQISPRDITSSNNWIYPGYPELNLSGDFNGDGKTDLVSLEGAGTHAYMRISNGTVFENQIWTIASGYGHYQYIKTGDFDGNGMTDILIWKNYQLIVYLSNGSGFTERLWASSAVIVGPVANTWAADFDGDGRTDFATRIGHEISMFLSTGSSFAPVDGWALEPKNWNPGGYTWAADFNGDGLTDIATVYGYEIHMFLSTGASFDYKLWNSTAVWGHIENTWVADFNGDGLADIATLNTLNNILIRYSTGTYFVHTDAPVDNAWGVYKLTGDFNGDGLTDIATNNTVGKIHLKLSTVYGFRSEVIVDSGNDFWTNVNGTGDFNGDGISDLYFSAAGVDKVKQSATVFPDMLKTATNGMGNTSSVAYLPLTAGSVAYEKGETAQYPYVDLQTAKQVVVAKYTPDGLGGTTTTRYTYGGDKVLHGGRGSVGFRWTKSVNENTGLETLVNYNQLFPYISMVANETQTLNGQKISFNSKAFSTKIISDNNTRYIPYVAIDSVSTYDYLTGAVQKNITTSSNIHSTNGNLLSTITTVAVSGSADIYKTFTEMFYEDPGTGHCHQFLPTTTQTYKTGPTGADISPTAVKTFTYNENCKPVTEYGEVVEDGVSHPGLTKTYSNDVFDYDGFGHVTGTLITGPDIEPREVHTSYDTRGRFAETITNEHDHVTTMTNDPRFGGVTSSTDANGLTATTEYDDFGQVEETTSAGGGRVITKSDWCTTNCSTVPSLGAGLNSHQAKFTITKKFFGGNSSYQQMAPDVITHYDSLGREIRTETSDASGNTIYVDTNYDVLGRAVASTQPYFSSAPADKNISYTSYDDLSRPVSTSSPDGGVASIEYEGLNVTYYNDVLDPITSSVARQSRTEINNIIGQNIETIDDAGVSIHREFDVNGNNIKILKPELDVDGITVLDPKGIVTSFEYDVFGRKESMNDPDMGIWSYSYNSLSELVSQTDAKQQTTLMTYDKMGRMSTRTDDDGVVTTWHYNDDLNDTGTTVSTMGLGKLDTVLMKNSANDELYRKTTDYTPDLGLPFRTTITHDATESFVTQIAYDLFNRPEVLTYPETTDNNKLKTKNVYDAAGLLDSVTSIDDATLYWKADNRDAVSRIIASTLGNGVYSLRTFDKAGRTNSISSHDASANTIHQATYQFDSLGNLRQRDEQRGSNTLIVEQYAYDNLNRLTTVSADGVNTLSNTYDILGNIRSKSGVGTYVYDSTRPHAVSSTGGITYAYNDNGSLSSDSAGQHVEWTTFNKPQYIYNQLPSGGNTYSNNFYYGPDRARYRRVDSDFINQVFKDTRYVGGIYEKTIQGTTTNHKHYIRGGDGVVATFTVTDDGAAQTEKLEYMHRDYQGSVVAVTSDNDANGDVAIIAQLGFDAFGKRKPVAGGAGVDPIIAEVTRGYTGHEHLDGVGLIHMNGRVYNPTLGRFLSPDPLVQAPNNLQSFNRYSYVFNNPMSYTDPSGYYSLDDLRDDFKNVRSAVGKAVSVSLKVNTVTGWGYTKPARRFMLKHEWARTAGSIVAGATCGPGCSIMFDAYIVDISGGSYGDIGKSVLTGSASALAFSKIAHQIPKTNSITKILVHGTIGGTMSHLSGGEFRNGFISAGVSQAISVYDGYESVADLMGVDSNNLYFNATAASIVGGSLSKATGGSFEQGAKVALFGRLYNDLYNAEGGGQVDLNENKIGELRDSDGGLYVLSTDKTALPINDGPLENSAPILSLFGGYKMAGALKSGVMPGGALNSNRYLRIGYGYHHGNSVFRISGNWIKPFTKNGHINLF